MLAITLRDQVAFLDRVHEGNNEMNMLTLFGLFAVTAMLVTYALENRSPWFVLAFAASCALASVYGFLQGAWPFGLVEAVWAAVAVHRWQRRIHPVPER